MFRKPPIYLRLVALHWFPSALLNAARFLDALTILPTNNPSVTTEHTSAIMKRLSVLLATMVVAAAALDPRAALEPRAKAIPKEDPKMGTATSQGCFKSEGLLEDAKYLGVKYEGHEVSEGKCEEFARKQKQPVFAMKGEVCYLGKEYPPKDDGVDDSKCKSDCPGYPRDICKCSRTGVPCRMVPLTSCTRR